MKIRENIPMIAVVTFFVGGIAMVINNATSGPSNGLSIDVKVPVLSSEAQSGEATYAKSCASCHGQNAGGSEQGPPLVYETYNPGHHGDAAFFMAVKAGVKQHHWKFGDMPAQPNVTKSDVAKILTYVRELQRANGIFYKPHNM